MREVIPPEIMCPAAGQGALGIEIREGDSATRHHLAFLDDAAARMATSCERALLRHLGGGCQVPIGAFAEVRGQHLQLTAVVAHPDGSQVLRESQGGDDPEKLAAAVAGVLLARGAEAILQEVYGGAAAAPQQP
jgi:hydroxymethylbilane synthase